MKRRTFLAGVAAATVGGFCPVSRRWVSTAEAAAGPRSPVPRLDGELVMDESALAAVSTDSGSHVTRTPRALLRPGSVEDIAKMVRYCMRHRIPVAARGQAHTTFGQGLVENGLIVEMAPLGTIHSLTADAADVDAGVLWKDLLAAASEIGRTPPVLTGYIGLSIGGTLSVGGISAGNRRGAQVDNVLALQVVTGRGDIVWCSETKNRDLFSSVLAGLGQCGIITRAIVRLVPAKPRVRTYLLHYTDNATFFADLRTLLARGEFDDTFTLFFPEGPGRFVYQLNAVKYFDPADPPPDDHLLRGLNDIPSERSNFDSTYVEFALRVDFAIDFFKQIGLWDGVLHPWFDVFLPGRSVEGYVGDVLPTLTPEDVGPTGFLLLFAQKRSALKRPLLRVPNDEWVFLFDILTAAAAPGPNPEFLRRMLDRNRTLYDRAARLGGTRYPIGSLEFTGHDWVRHYGELYLPFLISKRRFDPRGILTPGPGIFDS